MPSIAAVIEVVERAVVRGRFQWVSPLKPREAPTRTVTAWVDIDLDALQWDNDSDWHTRPAVAFRAGTPPESSTSGRPPRPPTVRCVLE